MKTSPENGYKTKSRTLTFTLNDDGNTGCYPHDTYFAIYDSNWNVFERSGWRNNTITSHTDDDSWTNSTNLADGTYHWRGRTKNDSGTIGPYDSNPFTFCVDNLPPSLAPTCNIELNADNTQYRITWNEPADQGCAGLHSTPYQVERTVDGNTNRSYRSVTYWGWFAYSGQSVRARVRARDAVDNWTAYGSYCNLVLPTPTLTPTPTPTPIPVWFQTQEGDVHAERGIRSKVSTGMYFSLDGGGGFPGVVSYGNDFIGADFSPGEISSKKWLANSKARKRNYEFFYALLDYPELISPPLDKKIKNEDLSDDTDGIIAYSGDIETGEDWNIGTQKIVLLTTGSFSIKSKIEVSNGGSLVVVAKEGINVDGGLGGENNKIQGIFITDGTFDSGSGNQQLIVEGGVIADEFSLKRDLGVANSTTPAEKFIYRPDMFLNLHPSLWLRYHLWEEVAP